MKIDVKKVAKLANLPLSADEEEKYSQQLAKILDYIDQLNKIDTSKVEPTFNVSEQKNIMGKDEIRECQPQNDTILNASQKNKGFFSVKKIF